MPAIGGMMEKRERNDERTRKAVKMRDITSIGIEEGLNTRKALQLMR